MPSNSTLISNEPTTAPDLTATTAPSAGFRYFAVWLAVCVVVYLFPLAAFRSKTNPTWFLSYWGTVVNTSYNAANQNADIVIFGDSTAAINIDPLRMSRDLGRKVIVLPNTSTSLPVTGFDPLERYLKVNKTPRLIVFYLSAWDLDFLHNPFTEIVEEGQEMLLIHGSWQDVARYARSNPRKVGMFPLHFYGSSNRIADFLHFRIHEVPSLDQGHILVQPHAVPMKPGCAFHMDRVIKGQNDSSSREAVDRFTIPGKTDAIVFISPLPSCTHIDEVQGMKHPGLVLAPLQVLPPERFRDDGWQAHMLLGAIGPSTDYLESVIRQKLGS